MKIRKNGSGDNLKRRYKCLVCKNGAILEPFNHKRICPCGRFNNYVRILKEHERFIKVLNVTNDDETIFLTPYRKPASDIPENEVFNFYFSSARTKIEHVNGMLKNRFSSLGDIRNQMKNQASFVPANEQVLVCLILHNFLLRINDVCGQIVRTMMKTMMTISN